MPSFSRATAAMRCIFAAWAISISEGISLSLWILRKTGFWRAPLPAALTMVKNDRANEKRRGAHAPRRLVQEPGRGLALALLAFVARRHLVAPAHRARRALGRDAAVAAADRAGAVRVRRRHGPPGSGDYPVDLLLR